MSQATLQLRNTVYSSLMAALIAAGAFISIPLGPVPITLQTFFVLLTGLLLGKKWGSASMAIYLLAGGIGLPVFSQARGGFTHFVGPTGGYLFGFLFAVFLVGAASDVIKEKTEENTLNRFIFNLIAATIGVCAIYSLGVPWLKIVAKMSWDKAISLGALPFLLGDAIKIIAAVLVSRIVSPFLNKSH